MEQNNPVVANKLTSWKNEPQLAALKLDLQNAMPAHQAQMALVKHWNDLRDVKGKAKPPQVKGRSQVQPKLVRRQAEWRYSAMTEPFLGTKKLFEVRPRTFEDGKSARQNELVINYQFDIKINKVKFIDDFVRSTVDDGTSIVQVGWHRRTIKVSQEVPKYEHLEITTQEEADAFAQALELSQADPRGFLETADPALIAAVKFYVENQQATVARQSGTATVQVEKVIENHPTVEVKSPHNVVIDPSCGGDFNKANFAIVTFETDRASLALEGKRYHNLDQVDWTGAAPIADPDHDSTTPGDFNFADKFRKKVVAHEYWGFYDIDGTGELKPIVATWIGNILIRMEENPFPDGKLPFVVVPYLPVKRQLHGETDAELLEDNQKIIGALMRGMIDLLGKSANSQQGFAKGMLDPLNRRRFDNGQDYEFNPQLTPAAGHITHAYPELPASALNMLSLQNQDAEALSGVKSFAGGVSGDAYGDVAAGIRGALDATSKREMAILRRLAKGMVEIGIKIAAMNAVFLSEEETIRITNTEFEQIKREDLAGSYDMVVDISTAEVDNAQAQDLAFMLQTLGNTVDVSITLMILAEICRLKRMPELEHALKTYQPKPDPLAQRKVEAEIAKLELEVEKLRSEVELNKAKTREAEAKAGAVETDNFNEATGIKHTRELERQEGQAQGNKELAVSKALLTPRKEGEGRPDIEAAVGYNALTSGAAGQTVPSPGLTVDNFA